MKPNDCLTKFLDSKKFKRFFSRNDVAIWISKKINPSLIEATELRVLFGEHFDDLNLEAIEAINLTKRNLEYASKLISIWLKLKLVEVSSNHASGLWYKVL